MAELWYALVGFLLAMGLILDGWNLGAGILQPWIARTPGEAREVIRALGPAWSWNEVWIIAFGGSLFLAFPGVYAASFSGFYLAFMVMLWLLVLRGLGIELGHAGHDPLWQGFCDGAFRWSSLGLAALLGCLGGNLVRGLPLEATGTFALPFFTDFRTGGALGLLDWYTLLAALLTVLACAAHGAGFLAVTARDEVQARAARWCGGLWLATAIGLVAVTLGTAVVQPRFLHALLGRPVAWVAALVLGAGLGAVWRGGARRRPHLAFLGGCAVLAALVAGAAAALFPVALPARTPGRDLVLQQAAATPHNLAVALGWWILAVALALGYLVVIVRTQSRLAAHRDAAGSGGYG